MASSAEVWIWLLLVMRPYNPAVWEILEKYDLSAERAAKAVIAGEIPFLSDEERSRAKSVRTGAVHELMKLCAENNIRIITFDDGDYPPLLKNIYNPPAVLFCAGDLSGLDGQFVISAVGTRHPSDYGYRVTEKMIPPLAKMGTVIVSGLALGLDAAAHKACLSVGGRTVGVLGCGIFVDYPRENRGLKRAIAERGGAVISELMPYDKPSAEYFKHRNRIISGLSHGTLVLEAGSKSGCLLTADHALEQGREVFAIPPHSILTDHFAGASALLRDGAIPVADYTDIVYAFYKEGALNEHIRKILDKKS